MSGNFSPTSTVFEQMYRCFNSTAGATTLTVFIAIDITVILPLCFIVLYLGLQRWRKQIPNTHMSHCDVFTYNMVLLDLMQFIGSVLCCYSVHTDVSRLISAGIYVLCTYLCGQMMFFPLTCVDYYLAIVFPIFYLGLKKPKFIIARNITIGLVWLCNFAEIILLKFLDHKQVISLLSILSIFLLLFVIFSCFSVLYVLIRNGPGEGSKRRVDKSKIKAFNTMIAILAVLTFRFLGTTVCNSVYTTAEMNVDKMCVVSLFVIGSGLPCSLLQPILFLQKTQKLPFFNN